MSDPSTGRVPPELKTVPRVWSGLAMLMAATADGKRAAKYQNLTQAERRTLAFIGSREGFAASVLKRGRSFLVMVEALRCVECGARVGMRGLCGECACEDDSAIW